MQGVFGQDVADVFAGEDFSLDNRVIDAVGKSIEHRVERIRGQRGRHGGIWVGQERIARSGFAAEAAHEVAPQGFEGAGHLRSLGMLRRHCQGDIA